MKPGSIRSRLWIPGRDGMGHFFSLIGTVLNRGGKGGEQGSHISRLQYLVTAVNELVERSLALWSIISNQKMAVRLD